MLKCIVEGLNQHLSTRDCCCWGTLPRKGCPKLSPRCRALAGQALLAVFLQQLWAAGLWEETRCQQRFHGVQGNPRALSLMAAMHNVPIVPCCWHSPRNAVTAAVLIKHKACFHCPALTDTLKQPLGAPGLLQAQPKGVLGSALLGSEGWVPHHALPAQSPSVPPGCHTGHGCASLLAGGQPQMYYLCDDRLQGHC